MAAHAHAGASCCGQDQAGRGQHHSVHYEPTGLCHDQAVASTTTPSTATASLATASTATGQAVLAATASTATASTATARTATVKAVSAAIAGTIL